jgi:hypothetical protein
MATTVVYTDDDELSVPALNAEERKWIEKAAKLFAEMPARLKLMEAGDAVYVVDSDGAKRSECCDGAAKHDGIVLADIHSATLKIFGVSG